MYPAHTDTLTDTRVTTRAAPLSVVLIVCCARARVALVHTPVVCASFMGAGHAAGAPAASALAAVVSLTLDPAAAVNTRVSCTPSVVASPHAVHQSSTLAHAWVRG